MLKNASCTVDNQIIGEIQQGFCVFIGVSNEDNTEIADKMIKKLIGMRIFEDENGKTNLSLADVDGSLLLISQFTLYADCKKGNRPSFTNAGNPELANSLYEYIIEKCNPLYFQALCRGFLQPENGGKKSKFACSGKVERVGQAALRRCDKLPFTIEKNQKYSCKRP